MHGKGPSYLKEMLVPYIPEKNLRSADKQNLVLPKVRTSMYGDRAFAAAAPTLWNNLPLDLKSASTVETFKSKLKTLLFSEAFS